MNTLSEEIMPKSFLNLLKQHRIFIITYLFVLIIALLIQLNTTKAELFLWSNAHYSAFLDHFFTAITFFGDGLTMILLGIGLLFVRYRFGILTLLAYAYTSAAAQILKRIFNLPRPSKYFEGIHEIRIVEGNSLHQWNSFPSGHSVSAFSLAVVLSILLPHRHKHWIILPLAFLTAYSRVYLAQHFFQDIVAGSVLGVVLTFQLTWWLENTKWYNSPALDGKITFNLIK